jgi:site-specific DNA recombinase
MKSIVANGHGLKQTTYQTDPPKVAAIYVRVSTEDQGKGYSIPTQIEACQALATHDGYAMPEGYVLIDDGLSGATLDRPALRQLRALIQARALAAVLVYDPDRLSRNLGHLLLLMEELSSCNVKLHIVSQPIDRGAEGMLLFQVRGAMAEYERAKLHERTTRGRLGRAKAGHMWGGAVPLGYTAIREPHKARWEIDEDEAAVVRRIYGLCLQGGLSTRSIARILSEEGVPSCLDRRRNSGYKRLPIGQWQPASVHNILTYEPYYTGIAYFNKRKSVGKHAREARPQEEWIALQIPTIIDRATFEAAQHQLAVNKKISQRNKKNQYLLSGRVRCARCGRTVSGYYNTSGQNRRYRCGSAYDLHAPKCPGSILADEIEAHVWGAVERALRKPSLIAEEMQRQHAHVDEQRATIVHEMDLCTKALERCDSEAHRWAHAYAGGVINLEELRHYRADIDVRRQSIINQQVACQARLEALAHTVEHAQMLAAYCQRVARRLRTFSMEEKQLALEALGIEVTWQRGEDIGLTGNIRLEAVTSTPSGSGFPHWPAGYR